MRKASSVRSWEEKTGSREKKIIILVVVEIMGGRGRQGTRKSFMKSLIRYGKMIRRRMRRGREWKNHLD